MCDCSDLIWRHAPTFLIIHWCVLHHRRSLLDTSLLKPGMRLGRRPFRRRGFRGSAAALSPRGAGNWAWCFTPPTCTTACAAKKPTAIWNFAASWPRALQIPFHEARVDTAAEARANPQPASPPNPLKRLRGGCATRGSGKLSSKAPLDAVATAHTLDDQAETVLAKFLRGAWTEGLSGIHPKLETAESGLILRPLLRTTRAEIEAYLNAIGQTWREDSSNRQLTFTRNRIRHELLPLLEQWNPQLRTHLAHMAALARDEESWWQAELDRIAPQLILRGRPVRGGGRASSEDIALDCTRLAALAPALQRRLLRRAAAELGAEPDFAATEALREPGPQRPRRPAT